ncbi:MAG TPA: dihydroxyacetone kinase phosphoryl donor subunit DhaM [Candidatus Saccharimonadales bacterium]|nr:dihydroxyacetone kinase phosphoryl donor subunit DhaM [Candidatus Saccharimonadales bacterium]
MAVGIVLVSHSPQLAEGLALLAGQMAGPDVHIEAAGGDRDGGLGTSDTLVRTAIEQADQGDGVLLLCDLGSAILTVRDVLGGNGNGHVRLVDAPFVEGAVAAAVVASSGAPLDEVARAAEEARDARKL